MAWTFYPYYYSKTFKALAILTSTSGLDLFVLYALANTLRIYNAFSGFPLII